MPFSLGSSSCSTLSSGSPGRRSAERMAVVSSATAMVATWGCASAEVRLPSSSPSHVLSTSASSSVAAAVVCRMRSAGPTAAKMQTLVLQCKPGFLSIASSVPATRQVSAASPGLAAERALINLDMSSNCIVMDAGLTCTDLPSSLKAWTVRMAMLISDSATGMSLRQASQKSRAVVRAKPSSAAWARWMCSASMPAAPAIVFSCRGSMESFRRAVFAP
mmetsp:Transcript_90477/g.258862  ORF Transcript_90477/g.258862 Transcript_90477/m.258862 type:complete len:219 (-) Transcript_90477:1029-1685(-)